LKLPSFPINKKLLEYLGSAAVSGCNRDLSPIETFPRIPAIRKHGVSGTSAWPMVSFHRSRRVLMLVAQELSKSYLSVDAVRNVTFSLEPGQVLGCLGPNGAGKSTTVKMLTGILEPSSGQVLFDRADIRENLPTYRSKLGYVPEESNLYPYLSGWEYLELVGTLRGLPRALVEHRADTLLRIPSLSRRARLGLRDGIVRLCGLHCSVRVSDAA